MKSLEEFIQYVKNRTYNLDVRYARGRNQVLVSVDFITDGHKENIIQLKGRKSITRLGQRVIMDNPQTIEITIHINDIEELHRYVNREKLNTETTPKPMINTVPMSGFEGVTPQSIEGIVNKRLEEERRERLLQELQVKLSDSSTLLSKKETEIESLKGDLKSKEQEIEQLEKTIENKKNFKYYAGITGDILQSFGIKKEMIGRPLAGLLAGDEGEETLALEQGSNEIETTSQTTSFTKRDEMINLLYQYIESIEDNTLEKVFEVFSEIESKPSSADKILEFIKANKQ